MKRKIREQNKIKRREMIADDVLNKSNAASNIFLSSKFYKNAEQIMLYMPLGNETDTTEIIKSAIKDGKKLIFPVTDRESGNITPIFYDEGDVFRKGAFSVREPAGNKVAGIEDIDVVIVPGIAFSKSGGRIGFGKGCYDKFLENFRNIKIGFCYEFQICDEFEEDEYDVKMDYIITEKEMIRCRKDGK